MCHDLRQDYERFLAQTSYRGFRRTLFTLTNPGFQAAACYRLGRRLLELKVPLLGVMLQRLCEVWTGISIPAEAKIGPGLLILHSGGIVINSKAVIGRDCTLHHGVTIGNRRSGGGSPVIGDRVMIGAGAKVLGEITVGSDSEIGANAVLLESVGHGSIAVGIPARVIRTKH